MKKGLRPRYLTLCSAVILATSLTLTASGAANVYPSAISVKAILPENQSSNVTYYDLKLSPGETQTVQLRVNNSEDTPVRATVELNPASTGQNGTIVYNQTDDRDESMRYSIEELASVRDPVVEIPARDSALVDIDIAMPREAVSGVVLGGLRVTADYPETISGADAPREEGIQIRNSFAYVIGLKLAQDDSGAEPDFHLKSLRPGLVNYSPSVLLTIQNSEPVIAKGISFSAQVFSKGSSQVLRELVKGNAEMAPNSSCDYVVDWGNTRIQPGTYRVLARMQHEDRVWEWDEEFTVSAGEVNDINSGALGLEQNRPAWLYVVLWLLLPLIILAFLFGRRSRDRKKEDDQH